MIKTMSNIEKKQRGLSVKYDERRVYELGFGNPDKNFRNYKFFTCDIRFGIAQPVLEEAAFQLLGYERFSITGMGDKMQNDGDDAVRFVNAVKERRQQLHEQGLPIGPEAPRGIIRELLAEHPLLAMPKTRGAERNRLPESSKLLDNCLTQKD